MSWWNRYKKLLSIALVVIICVLPIGLASLMLIGPLLDESEFCTLVGCYGNGVRVDIVGQKLDASYTIEVDFPSGKKSITCFADSATDGSDVLEGSFCELTGAFFEQIDSNSHSDTPPEELTVTVIFKGKKITKTFHPEYEVHYPNGENCDPMCYFTTIEFDLSE